MAKPLLSTSRIRSVTSNVPSLNPVTNPGDKNACKTSEEIPKVGIEDIQAQEAHVFLSGQMRQKAAVPENTQRLYGREKMIQ